MEFYPAHMSTSPTSLILTVSHLNKTVRELLEGEMGQLWLTGEISIFPSLCVGSLVLYSQGQPAQVLLAMFRTPTAAPRFRRVTANRY